MTVHHVNNKCKYSCLGEGGSESSRADILGINVNIIIIFLHHTWLKKILRNKIFQARRSKVKAKGSPGHINTSTAITYVF